jgi:phage terminase large subunit
MNVQFPAKLKCLFRPKRYKVAHGGRGSAKSWGFARALLILAAQRPLRVLCAREVQKSIKDSVHRLLTDQIQALGLGTSYEVFETEIRGRDGSLFLFAGLAQHTVESIKSYEGVDVVWVEEAQVVTKRSWDVLTPTIRKEGSEIWITLNPDMETDETYSRFVLGRPYESEDAFVVQMNWRDNPWFPEVLERERQATLKRDPDNYDNIWEGKCRPAAEGAIYYKEVAAAEEGGRICNLPYDPLLKVHVIVDLGWNDAMSISLVQKQTSAIAVLENIEDSHKTLDHYSAELKKKNMNWGSLYLPHDGRHKDYKTGKSAEDIMKALGWDVKITPNMSIEDGIRLTRMTFPRLYFDRVKAARLIECAKRYRRSVHQTTGEPGAPLHDEYSHGADSLRYLAVNAESMTNEDFGKIVPLASIQPDEDGLYF